MGEIADIVSLANALLRLFGIDQSALLPTLAMLVIFFAIAIPIGLSIQGSKVVTGEEGMIGEPGVATTDVSPTGTVFVRGEYWSATSEDEIPKGAEIEVVSVSRMTLTVKSKQEV
jgi:membrane-bound serine protease (ClpP class)